MKIAEGSTLVMTGDSITDCGRQRPVGQGDGLGDGYVSLVAAFLAASYPARRIRVLNTGIGGDTTRRLMARWGSDVAGLKPDWLSIMIGTNDVWRQFDAHGRSGAVLPDEYEANLARLIGSIRPSLAGLTLMTPFYIEMDKTDPMRRSMDEYGAIVKRIAKENDCIFVDTQADFDVACESIAPLDLAFDRVHPSLYGSAVLARAFLRAVEFEL